MVSVIVIAEFLVKAPRIDKQKFVELLKRSEVVAVDKEIVPESAKYRNKFLRKTEKVFLLDCFLAAQAKVRNLNLVTNNKTDFPMRDIKRLACNLRTYFCSINHNF